MPESSPMKIKSNNLLIRSFQEAHAYEKKKIRLLEFSSKKKKIEKIQTIQAVHGRINNWDF